MHNGKNWGYSRFLDDYDPDLMMVRRKKKPKVGGQGLHWSKKTLEQMTSRDWRIFKEDNNIQTKGRAPLPLRDWDEANLPAPIRENIRRVGYHKPTAIQSAALPAGLKNLDVVGIAETGSGKTAAFIIPMLVYLYELPRLNKETALDGPYSLIMAPSRELAQQIYREFLRLSRDLHIRAVDIVGGLSIEKQGFNVCEGAEVVIGTPGRLLDCVQRRYLALNQCYYVIMDEADTMIDMNFETQIRAILDYFPASNLKPTDPQDFDKLKAQNPEKNFRQTIMFSATMKPSMERLSKQYLRGAIYYHIGESRDDRINRNIRQSVMFLPTAAKKDEALKQVLREQQRPEHRDTNKMPKTIVFCNEKNTCNHVVRYLNDQSVSAIVIYSGLMQQRRMMNLQQFRDNKIDVLVGTDLVGRGIDVKDVALVVNYDVPNTIEKYTHRIGRTGRAGARGIAVSFMVNEDTDIMYDLRETLKRAGSAIPSELRDHPASKFRPGNPKAKTMRRKGKIIFAN